ncbi:MAG: hypothetical protein HQRvContig01_21 [Haloquadratum phage sp.]|nr:MAG: hypothetical protein HQRvContig01_21 [Haloquadratum phage sp.]
MTDVANRVDTCQDCEEAPATHVCQMTISGIPIGPLYVCEDCYPEVEQNDDN